MWVGIDGYSDSTVEQIGTEENVVNGVPQYHAWWKMYSAGKSQPETGDYRRDDRAGRFLMRRRRSSTSVAAHTPVTSC